MNGTVLKKNIIEKNTHCFSKAIGTGIGEDKYLVSSRSKLGVYHGKWMDKPDAEKLWAKVNTAKK